ncbi:hypothetical protein ACQV2W_00780 [Facklamia sp. P12934]|uniref:hypothetical protein n=1 Tax=Facklamia sp. P12934 TaxID=3421948 RepID=UPI003D17D5AF
MKPVLLQVTENLRIVDYDDRNVALEMFSTGFNPKTKEKTQSWKTAGFFSSIRSSLRYIVEQELITDTNTLNKIESVSDAIERSNQVVLEAIERLGG